MSRPNPESLSTPGESSGETSLLRRLASPGFWLTFLLMAAAWIVFSGRFDAFHLGLGALSCALVAFFSSDLLFPKPLTGPRATIAFRFTAYLPWLLYEIVLANWHVLKLCLSPRMHKRLDPSLVAFDSTLRSELALVTLANSITLTPGTITVRVTADGKFLVHAIDAKSADMEELLEMERKVARTFREEE